MCWFTEVDLYLFEFQLRRARFSNDFMSQCARFVFNSTENSCRIQGSIQWHCAMLLDEEISHFHCQSCWIRTPFPISHNITNDTFTLVENYANHIHHPLCLPTFWCLSLTTTYNLQYKSKHAIWTVNNHNLVVTAVMKLSCFEICIGIFPV